MPEPAAVRQLTTALAFAYPVLAHLAVARNSAELTIAAIGVLAAISLLPGLVRGAAAAWLAVPFVCAACWWLSQVAVPVLPLYLPPIIVPAFFAYLFGSTLMPGRTPLICQLIRVLHTSGDEPDSAVWSYARRLTAAWTALFVTLAALNLVLAGLAEPDGLLRAGGLRPPLSVSQDSWSLFTNLIEYLVVAAFFLIEYAYRRQRFPRQPYRNLFDFLRQLRAAMPRIIGRPQ
ncbi:MAG: ketosynthase [Steroidobacteraceae bacterium]